MAPNSGRPSDSDTTPPLGRDVIRSGRFDSAATERVPDELRRIDLLPDPKPYELRRIGRRDLGDMPADPLPPNRPAWMHAASRPRRARMPGVPPTTLRHHGAELEPAVIWQPEDRKTYNDTSYPWGCVCRIINAASRVGSGVIVGPRHVLTASHCVDWATAAGTVEVHRAGPAVSAVTRIEAVWSFTEVAAEGPGYSDVDEDYAVLITADRIGDRFGWLGVRTYTSDWDDEPFWHNIGYPTDIASGLFPIHQRDKSMDEDEFDYGTGRAMTTTADVMKGQSGGPMFSFWDDGPSVVAVVSAFGVIFLSGVENWCSGGSDLLRLCRHAIANDP